MTTLTRKTRIGSRKDLIERAHRHATDLGPTINAIRAVSMPIPRTTLKR
jgi:hypothetical protein